jgi:hypothetical protein
MSQQLWVRFAGNSPAPTWEGSVIARGYSLLESLKDEVGARNILAVPLTSDEEALREEIEDALGGEPEDEELAAFEAFEDAVDLRLGVAGEFHAVPALLADVLAFQAHFAAQSARIFALDERHSVTGAELARDLGALARELGRGGNSRARLVIG